MTVTEPGEDTPAAEDAPLVPGVAPLTAFPPEPGDPGHLVPDEDWEQIVRQAEQEGDRIRRGQPPPEAPVSHGLGTGLGLQLAGTVVAPSHGAARGRPTFGVFHTMETPLRAGYAASIARYFAGGPGTSCHYNVDPAETWGVLPDTLIAWAVGTANTRSLNLEMAGRAAMTRAEWTGADGMAQHRRAADVVRHGRDEYGIGIYLMSDQQLRDAHAGRIVGGWTDHNQCRRVIGGTTHTDVGTGCPLDVILELADSGATPAPSPTGTEDDMGMRLVKVAGTRGPIYVVTDLDVNPTNDVGLVDTLKMLHGIPVVDVNPQMLGLLQADAAARRARLGLDQLTRKVNAGSYPLTDPDTLMGHTVAARVHAYEASQAAKDAPA